MSTAYDKLKSELANNPRRFLVTGVAGFIGSSLLQTLLELGQEVVGLDNFETGYQANLTDVERVVGSDAWKRFRFIEGDITDSLDCEKAVKGVHYVLHQAALGSVPRSIVDPLRTHRANIDGYLNMLIAARDQKVQRFVYASSSAVYGDHPALPKRESEIGNQLSPYAVTKYVNELYARNFAEVYGFRSIGLRYFNVFGPRQDPDGAYAAVIPKWIGQLLKGEPCQIFGDGETSRDFCYVDNVVQANLLAALATEDSATNRVYNVAFGDRTSLNDLYNYIYDALCEVTGGNPQLKAHHASFRGGDIRHSLADISEARTRLGYEPVVPAKEGFKRVVDWFVNSRK